MAVNLIKTPVFTAPFNSSKAYADWLRDIANDLERTGGMTGDDLWAMGHIMAQYAPVVIGKHSTFDSAEDCASIGL